MPSEDEDPQGHLLGGGGYGERAGAPRSGTQGSQASHAEYFQAEGLVGTPRALVSLGKAVPQHRAGLCWRGVAFVPQGPLQVTSSWEHDGNQAAPCHRLIPNELVKAFLA